MQTARPSRRSLTGVVALVLVAGAASIIATAPPATVDVAAAELDLGIVISDGEASPPDGKVLVAAQFVHNGRAVQLGSNARVSCNGVDLPWQSLGYMARVPIVPVGGAYVVTHTRNATATPASVPVPARPAILSPVAGATIPRGALTVTYTPGSGVKVSASAYGHRTGAGEVSVTAGDQPDNGTYTGLVTTSFEAGAGFVTVHRTLNSSPAGTGFRSVEVTYNSGSRVNVTWN